MIRSEPPPDSGPAVSSWLRWVLRVAIVVPMVVAASRAVATGWFPVGDSALLAIRAHDVGTTHHPLLGSWTSASLTLGTDVNNPGPLYPDLLAPFMWTIGRWSSIGCAVAVGVASVNAAFALLAGWAGHVIGGWRVERWALLMVAALTWSMGSELLIDIWQPHALLVPFSCLLLLTTGLVAGRWRLLPVWLAVASLVVQTHIGYVYIVSVLGLLVVGHACIAARRRGMASVVRSRTVRWSVLVIALAWVQPLIEQVFGEGRGNLLRLASNASGGDVTIGAGLATKLVARVVALPPWWTRFGFEDSVVSTPLTETVDGPVLMVPGLPGAWLAAVAVVVLLAVLGGLTVLLRGRDAGAARAAIMVSTVSVAAALLALSIQTVSVVGLGSHQVRWLFVLALFVQVSIAWSIVELGVNRLIPTASSVGVPALIGLFVVGNLPLHAHDLGPTADRAATETLERTFVDLATFDPGGPVRYDVDNLRAFEPWSAAVQMRLVELGIEFRVADEGFVRQLGDGRRASGNEVTAIRQIERGAALAYEGGGCVISLASPFDAEVEADADALVDAAVGDLVSGAVVVDTTGLGNDLPARFAAAVDGDRNEARVLVADGVMAFLAADGRIIASTEATDAVVQQAERIERRVTGSLLLIAEPAVGC